MKTTIVIALLLQGCATRRADLIPDNVTAEQAQAIMAEIRQDMERLRSEGGVR